MDRCPVARFNHKIILNKIKSTSSNYNTNASAEHFEWRFILTYDDQLAVKPASDWNTSAKQVRL